MNCTMLLIYRLSLPKTDHECVSSLTYYYCRLQTHSVPHLLSLCHSFSATNIVEASPLSHVLSLTCVQQINPVYVPRPQAQQSPAIHGHRPSNPRPQAQQEKQITPTATTPAIHGHRPSNPRLHDGFGNSDPMRMPCLPSS